MKDPILMLYGGMISIVSLMVGIVLQYYFEREKVKLSFKQHPLTTVYNKQIEFIEKLFPILYTISNILVQLDIEADQKKVREDKLFKAITKINKLIFAYYIFIPSDIHDATSKYVMVCYDIIEQFDKNVFGVYQQTIMELENTLRNHMGIEPLTKDIITAINLGHGKKKG